MKAPVKTFDKLSLRRFFALAILSGVLICSALYTVVQTWRDFSREKISHQTYQRQISELMVASLKAPLLQGGLIESRLRIQSFSKEQPQVLCVAAESLGETISSCDETSFESDHIFKTENKLYFDSNNPKLLAKIRVYYDNSDLYHSWKKKLLDSIVINFVVAILVFTLISLGIAKFVKGDLQTVLAECNPDSQDVQSADRIKIKEFSQHFEQLRKYMAAAKFNAEAHAASEVAKQVAHDIRSPLAAIRMTIDSLDSIDADHRKTIRSGFERINDIANDLMNRWPAGTARFPATTERRAELIDDLVDGIVSEKRIQYRSRSRVSLELNVDKKSRGLFAHIEGPRLKRALSNIIDNSFEAIDRVGKITVNVKRDVSTVLISVQDTGKGIAPHILPKLMQKGGTYGKVKGNGLGLYDAQKTVNAWGGSISIESVLDSGTTVKLTLPQAEPPNWFPQKICLSSKTTIVSVDDDVSVQEIWRSRFNPVCDRFDDVKFLSFSSTTEFMSWYRDQKTTDDHLFLIDYEFLQEQLSGLQMIEELGISAQSILVTSRYAEPVVSQKAKDIKVPILPKNLAGFVPFEISA